MKTSQEKKQSNLTSGTIWQVGKHRIAHGDSRDKTLIDRLFNNDKAKTLICDIPYGINYTESKEDYADIKVKKTIQNDNLTNEVEYIKFNEDWLRAIIPHLTSKNTVYIFNCDKMIFALREAMLNVKIYLSQLIVWVKNQPVIGRMDYLPQHELIAYGWFGRHEFLKGKDKSVLFYPRPNSSPFHPTTKSSALIKNLILNSSRVSDIVFDGFLGSGTTALACEETGRICYGCEIDLEYCKTIIRRFEKRYGITAVELTNDHEITARS